MAATPDALAQNPTTCDHPNIGCCGDITLILLNPDLQPGSDGFIRASGNFFVQFQAIGEGADRIANFGFSFGAYTAQVPEDVCSLPPQAWWTGQQILNYRADTNADDGFFINLQTPLVPDGQYTAALHAYDASDNELARFWASAIVENCDDAVDPAGLIERCDGDVEQIVRNDFIMPWPIVLPGDGLTTADVDGFTLEFAEELSALTVLLNGEDITAELTGWEGRLWDDDLIPGYGPYGLANILVPECSQQPPQECSHLGVAYQWTERQLTEDDVLRVEATDLAENVGTKDLHIGSGVTSGAISADIPVLEWSVDRQRATVGPGEPALFRFTITNRGGSTGHPFAEQEVPADWQYEWQPAHVPVDSGTSEAQEFIVTPPADATTGVHEVKAFMNYVQQGVDKQLRQDLVVEVVGGTNATQTDPLTDEAEDSAVVPLPLVMLAAALVVVWVRRVA
jgi:hypothetical protein